MDTASYTQLKKLAKQCTDGKRRLAVIGDSATQQLATALRGESVRRGDPLSVYDADYDQMEALLLDPDSELFAFTPDYILLFPCSEKAKLRFYNTVPAERTHFAERELARLQMFFEAVRSNSKAKIILPDFPESEDSVFGSFALKTPQSFAFQLRKLNMLIAETAANLSHVYPLALGAIQTALGREAFFEDRTWYLAKMAVRTDALPAVASRILDLIAALSGKVKKCVIADLDNTLWGGVIGDDGMNGIRLGELGDGPAFTALQRWLLELRRRGILLCICSKNNDDTAREPFEKHPEMVLRMEDIVVFTANWENKADNIRAIQKTLNIGFDSLVFLDDNPFERNLVREMLPDVTVPELPEDPAEVPHYLESLHLFEAVGFSEEDAARTAQYQAEASRVQAQASFVNYDDYLKSLEMHGEIKPFDAFHAPRIAQLTQRSNQFNLRTQRYSEADILAFSQDDGYITRYMTQADKFSDNGLIAVVILKKTAADTLFVDTWLMSCRVLRRGVEECLFDNIVRFAAENGFRTLTAEYIPTAKNKMVADFYDRFGMTPLGDGKYTLNLADYQPHTTYITVD
ncbi:MAG: HAD family hydrolase [Oscillospiraceae bacterium]|nr:HAD family hydrolase [Oscillospiraceae bacterium]